MPDPEHHTDDTPDHAVSARPDLLQITDQTEGLRNRLDLLLDQIDVTSSVLTEVDLPPGLRARLGADLRTARVGVAAAVEDLNGR
jgi:hypothetical protein